MSTKNTKVEPVLVPDSDWVDLGAGYFLANDDDGVTVQLIDSLSPKPGVLYGAAAWAGGNGPSGGEALLDFVSDALDRWLYGYESEDDVARPSSWPTKARLCRLNKSDPGIFKELVGREFSSRAALLNALATIIANSDRPRSIATVSREERLHNSIELLDPSVRH